MNIDTSEAKKSKDVELALSNGFKHKEPVIINIFTDPNALAIPPSPTTFPQQLPQYVIYVSLSDFDVTH